LLRRYAASVLARECLREVATVLGERGIPVMPLKGALFQLLLYADPAERALTDVDILVPRAAFSTAVELLSRAGFVRRSTGRSLVECAFRAPSGMMVDLHQQLFSPARYRLSTQDLFRRAIRDAQLLGVPLYLAHPHDTAAHLIGKFVSDHVVAERWSRLNELLLWVRHFGVEPGRLARHLERHGLGRAARYALSCGIESHGDPFFGAALAALPCDPVGWVCARTARSLIPRGQRALLATASAHLLNSSLPRAATSVAWSAINRWRHARRSARPV
jgi:hypothetical protein